MTKLLMSANQPVHVRDAVTSTAVMRLITSCIELGTKSTLSVANTLITKISTTNGLLLSSPGGSMEI